MGYVLGLESVIEEHYVLFKFVLFAGRRAHGCHTTKAPNAFRSSAAVQVLVRVEPYFCWAYRHSQACVAACVHMSRREIRVVQGQGHCIQFASQTATHVGQVDLLCELGIIIGMFCGSRHVWSSWWIIQPCMCHNPAKIFITRSLLIPHREQPMGIAINAIMISQRAYIC